MSLSEDVQTAVVGAVVTVSGRDRHEIGLETRLISDLHLESIDIIDILFEIEKRLGVSVNLADVFQRERRLDRQAEQFDLALREITSYIESLQIK